MKNNEAYKVIDGDNMICLEIFHKSKLKEKLEYYKSLGKWGDVSVDIDGDIVLFEDSPINEEEW